MSNTSHKSIKLLNAFLDTRKVDLTDEAFELIVASLAQFSCDILASAIKALMNQKIYSGDVSARLLQECENQKLKSFEKLLLIEDKSGEEETFNCHLCRDAITGTASIVTEDLVRRALNVATDRETMPKPDDQPHVGSCAAWCSCSHGQRKKEQFMNRKFGEQNAYSKMQTTQNFGDATYHIHWYTLQDEAIEMGVPIFERLVCKCHDILRGLDGGQSNRSNALDEYTQEAMS